MTAAPLLYVFAQEEPRLVGGDVQKPERVRFVPPTYPEGARASNLQSVVILELTVDREGNVASARSLRGAAEVVPAALSAARQWKYAPTFVDGAPVSVRFSETVLFVLRRADSGARGGNGMFLRPPDPTASRETYADWEVEGEAFTACPCDTPCPCRSNAPPSHSPCHATTTQHFRRGHYGDVDLSGMTFVSLGPENWTALYFDESSTVAQRLAVIDIYASMAPGAPQVYRSVRTADIHYEASEDRSSKRVEIPGILEVASRVRTGAAGLATPGMDVWANWISYGDTGTYRYQEAELGEEWDHSGRQSNHKSFTTSKRMYDEGRMLIQHGDGSGAWTDRQRGLIACLR